MLQFSSLNFDASFHELFLTWASGGTIVLITLEQQRDPHLLSKEIRDNSVERLNLPAAVIDVVLEELTAVGWGAVRELISTAEQMQIAPRWWGKLEQEGCAVWNHYGPSESHVITAWQAWSGALGGLERPPIGKPIANCRTYVLDRGLQPAPVGVVGELYLGGIGIARGYLNRPEQTAERFAPDPHSRCGGERVYRTGDVARYLDDGNIEYLGRIDHQVKIRGYRVELGEVEVALRQQSGIEDAVVVMREGPSGDKRLVGYVVGAGEVSGRQLREYLQGKLPEYMVPGAFVALKEFPLTPNGKVDRRALPGPEFAASEQEYVAPRGAVEEIVAGIFAQALKRERAGIRDNFFEQGGHSLLATQVISRLKVAFEVELPLRALFESPTVEGLARRVESAVRQGQAPTAPELRRADRGRSLPLSFAQQRLWFIDQLEPESALYNMPAALRMEGELDVGALERSLQEIVRRHEALRTSFSASAGEPAQVISEDWRIELPLIDLRHLPADERMKAAEGLAGEEAARPFDLSRGPLLRCRLLRLSEQDHALVVNLHHIVSDGWSEGILIRELTALYEAYSRGEQSPLAELEVQYADFAVWQREWLTGEVLEQQLGYWRIQLAGLEPLNLPTDHPRPAVTSHRGGVVPFSLSAELTGQLTALSQREGATLFMTLLAAFQALLYLYTDNEDVVVGSAIANRHHPAIEPLIGFFVNMQVIRTNLSGNPGFCELLKRTREACLGAYAHQDLPFEILIEELRPERDLSANPLFQVVFHLQNNMAPEFRVSNLRIDPLEVDLEMPHFDLIFSLTNCEQGLVGKMEYSKDLFEYSTINRMAHHFGALLKLVVENPELKLLEIRLSISEQAHMSAQLSDFQQGFENDQFTIETY